MDSQKLSRGQSSILDSIQLFQLTLSDQSFKPKSQDRKIVRDFYALIHQNQQQGAQNNNTEDSFYFKLLCSCPNVFSLYNVTGLSRSLIRRNGFQVQTEKGKLTVACLCAR